MAIKTADLTEQQSIEGNLLQWCFEKDIDEYRTKAERNALLFMSATPQGGIVDLGCGDGAAVEKFIASGYKTVAVDINKEKLNKVNPKAIIKQEDFLTFLSKQNDDSIDNVFCNHALEHFVNPTKVLDEIRRVIKPGGLVMIVVPHETNPHEVHHASFENPNDLVPKKAKKLLFSDEGDLLVLWTKETDVSKYISVMDHPHGGQLLYERAHQYATSLPADLIFVDIGTYKGGSTMVLMKAIADSGKRRWLWSIDPYGAKPYRLGTTIQKEANYDETIYQTAMMNMSNVASQLNVNHYHWRMTSEDFIKTINRIKFYDHGKEIKKQFGFLCVDGDHDGEVVDMELQWFLKHMPKGGIVLDDVPYISERQTPLVTKAIKTGMHDNFRCYVDVKDLKK